jgi:hypothetical protein
MSADASQRLADAHAKVAAAEKKLAAASKASEAAGEFAARIAVELVAHSQRHQDRADAKAATLMRALKVGSKPKIAASPKLAADHIAKIDAEHRSEAAKQALHSLVGEESSAHRELDSAVVELHAAARAVIADETSALVRRITELEEQSMRVRLQVEAVARSGVMGLARQLDDATKEVLRGNSLSALGVTNHSLWRAANVEAEHVRQKYDSLLKNPAPVTRAA